MKTIKGYKFVTSDMKLFSGTHHWIIEKWYEQNGIIELCNNGFHACKAPLDSLGFMRADNDKWFMIEARGEIINDTDKFVASEMRLVKEIKNVELISAKIAIYAAEQVLPLFEQQYPDDKRPREAILAAKRYMKNKTSANKKALDEAAKAAYAAVYYGAYAAGAAYYAARAAEAAYAAKAAEAAKAAYDAVYYAAYAAEAAYYAAVAEAAYDVGVVYAARAAEAALKKKINAKLLRLIRQYGE